MFDYKNREIGNILNFDTLSINEKNHNTKGNDNNEQIFIPYYVGRASKNNTIVNRLKKHHEITKSPANKYIRMKEEYYSKFFSDCCFPLHIYEKNKIWIENQYYTIEEICKNIEYFNNKSLLKRIHDGKIKPKSEKKLTELDCPLNEVLVLRNNNMSEIKDSLKEIISDKNNFWFCYLPLPKISDKEILQAEPLTFYALKGKTISKTVKFKQFVFPPITPEPSCSYLFHLDQSYSLTPKTGCSDGWPGYSKIF